MIVRVLRGRVTAGHVRPFRERAQRALSDARRQGCVYSQVGRQAHKDGSEEIVVITVWAGMEALYGWLGTTDLLATPILGGDGDSVLEEFDVQHFEVVELASAADAAEGASADLPES